MFAQLDSARTPSPLAGEGGGRSPPDEGGRAERDGSAKLRSIRHCLADPRHRQFRRPNYKFVRQPENLKALFSQPGATGLVGKPLLRNRMARTVNFHNQPTFEADKINDKIAQRNLPVKLRAVASPVAHRAPNQCLGLNGLRTLLARETAQYRSRDVLRHDLKRRRILRVLSNRSPRAPSRSPSSVVASQRHLPPQGGKDSAAFRRAIYPTFKRNSICANPVGLDARVSALLPHCSARATSTLGFTERQMKRGSPSAKVREVMAPAP